MRRISATSGGGGKVLFETYLTQKGWSASNFYKDEEQAKTVNAELEKLLESSDCNVTVKDIIDNLTDCRYLKGLDGECGIIGRIGLSNYSAPFFRSYEIRFDIDVDLSDATINGFGKPMKITMPYTPADGQLTYALNLFYLDAAGKIHNVPCTYDKETGTITFTTTRLSGFFMDALNMDAEKAYSLFSDVKESSWYFDDVMYVYEKGLMKGTTVNTFEPNAVMSRAMLVNTLYNMAGESKTNSGYAIPQDIGTFGPDDPVTREQLADILWRYAKYKGLDLVSSKGQYPGVYNYADVFAVSEEMLAGVDWACSNGIIKGTDNGILLKPQSTATRAEVAAVLKRFLEI